MAHSKSLEPIAMIVDVGALSATSTRAFPGRPYADKWEVVGISLVDSTAITGDDTNYYSFAFKKGTIASPTTITTYAFTSANSTTANVPVAVSLAAITSATCRLTTSDVLHVVATKNGTASNLGTMKVCFWVAPILDHGNER